MAQKGVNNMIVMNWVKYV